MRFGAHMPMLQQSSQQSAANTQGGTSQAAGQKRRGHVRQLGGVGMLLHHASDLGIGAAGVAALTTLRQQHELEKVKLQHDEQTAKVNFRYAMTSDNATEASVMQAAQAVANAELALRMMRFRHLKAATAAANTGAAAGKVVDVKAVLMKKRAQGGGGAGTGGGGGGGKN